MASKTTKKKTRGKAKKKTTTKTKAKPAAKKSSRSTKTKGATTTKASTKSKATKTKAAAKSKAAKPKTAAKKTTISSGKAPAPKKSEKRLTQKAPPDEERRGRKRTAAPLAIRAPRTPTHEEIARRAYELWERRGYQHGYDREDWLIAEAELSNGLL